MKRASKILLAIDSIREHLSDSESRRLPSVELRANVLADTGCSEEEYGHAFYDLVCDGQITHRNCGRAVQLIA